MSRLLFFPISWFEDARWKSVQTVGRLEDGKSIFLRIGFRPYFTVKYSPELSLDDLESKHAYLISETPVEEVTVLDETQRIYRIYVKDREDYHNTVRFYSQNGEGTMLDRDQEVKSKFFAEKRIRPGSWQQAFNLQTLRFDTRRSSTYTVCDFEFFTNSIQSLEGTFPLPPTVDVFYDIEAIPSDDVHFPDADEESPPDSIFAISMIVGEQNLIYILTDQEIPARFITSTQPQHQVTVFRCATEKEILDRFFAALAQVRPDRMMTMNGPHFDINYIGTRAALLEVEIPPFTKLVTFRPFFREVLLVQTKPFPSRERVLSLFAPGISQIDLLNFYRRTLPQLGNHRLETLGRVILGRGKTGLEIKEMFARFRRGNPQDIATIIDYSIVDSVLLKELWKKSQIDLVLAQMADQWRNDSEYVTTHEREDLFEDLFRYFFPTTVPQNYQVGRPPSVERKSGIHRHVYIYSLSAVYLTFLEQLGDPVADFFVTYFRDTNDGIIPFQSGYFPVLFQQVVEFIRAQIPEEILIWMEDNSVAVKGESLKSPQDQGPVPFFPLLYYIPLIVISQKSWILVDVTGAIYKKGMSGFVRPPFPLIGKHIDHLIRSLLERPGDEIYFAQPQFDLDDYVLEMKVKADDLVNPPKRKEAIIQQLREKGLPVGPTWRKVKYIQTKDGPVIEEIFSLDPERYSQLLDTRFYNRKVQEIIKSVLE